MMNFLNFKSLRRRRNQSEVGVEKGIANLPPSSGNDEPRFAIASEVEVGGAVTPSKTQNPLGPAGNTRSASRLEQVLE